MISKYLPITKKFKIFFVIGTLLLTIVSHTKRVDAAETNWLNPTTKIQDTCTASGNPTFTFEQGWINPFTSPPPRKYTYIDNVYVPNVPYCSSTCGESSCTWTCQSDMQVVNSLKPGVSYSCTDLQTVPNVYTGWKNVDYTDHYTDGHSYTSYKVTTNKDHYAPGEAVHFSGYSVMGIVSGAVGMSVYSGATTIAHCEGGDVCYLADYNNYYAPTTPGVYTLGLVGCVTSNAHCVGSTISFLVDKVAPTKSTISVTPAYILGAIDSTKTFTLTLGGDNSPDYYNVKYDDGTPFRVNSTTWSSTPSALKFSAGTTHTFKAQACNSAGCSSWGLDFANVAVKVAPTLNLWFSTLKDTFGKIFG